MLVWLFETNSFVCFLVNFCLLFAEIFVRLNALNIVKFGFKLRKKIFFHAKNML